MLQPDHDGGSGTTSVTFGGVPEASASRAQRDGTMAATADPRAVAQVLFALLPGFVLEALVLEDVTPQSYVEGLRGLLG